jgi:hypothetical protein
MLPKGQIMRKTIGSNFVVFLLFIVCGCGRNDPASVTRAFLEASSRKDKASAEKYLTKLARQNINYSGKDKGGTVSITDKDPVTGADRKWDDYNVGDAVITDDSATVPVTSKNGNKPETIRFKLKQDEGAWRIYAFAIPVDQTGTEITLDLEHPERIAGELLKILPQELGEGLKKLGEGFIKAGAELSKEAQKSILPR